MQALRNMKNSVTSAAGALKMRMAVAMATIQQMAPAAAAQGRAVAAAGPVSANVPGQTLIHRFGDHMSGVIYAGTVLVLGAIFAVESGDVVNYTSVDTIVTDLTDTYTTAAGLLILLVLAIIFGFALFYLNFAGGSRQSGGRSRSRT